ncbi:hypothetical protein SD71_12230 [Cohnella kolymensis]|uniref:Uncharacterized protein n=1 Tax=Cohnella kolymensis TaxID=1590652 RepID=A0ABR5A3T1_9BACL|nr:hypothetical protein [Cohnella kolymensis]KIL35660.1 hypothetical protein SD71_12230 [Cohnella kolymensis]
MGEHSFDVDLEKMSPVLAECSFELYHTDQNKRTQAKQMGLTINKLLVYEQAKQRGITLNTEELRTHSIALSLQDAGVNMESFFGEQATAIQLGSEEKLPETAVTEQTDEVLSPPAAVKPFNLQVQERPAVNLEPEPNLEKEQRAKKSGKRDNKGEDDRPKVERKDRDESEAQEDKSVEDHAGGQEGSERQDDDTSGSGASSPDVPDDHMDSGDTDDPLDDDGTEQHNNPDSQEDHRSPGDVNNEVNPGSDYDDDGTVIPVAPVNVDDKDSKEDKRKKTDQDDKHNEDNQGSF